MVVQLLKYGADPSLIDGEGCSCVHLAAQFGHTSIVAYLIAKGQVWPIRGPKPCSQSQPWVQLVQMNHFGSDRFSL